MPFTWKWVPWITFGLALLLGTWIARRCPALPGCWTSLAHDIYNFQALIAGVLAVIAGAGSVVAIYNQTRSHEAEARDRRERLVRAYRAGLTEDLAALAKYAEACARLAKRVLSRATPTMEELAGDVSLPELSPRIVANVRILIENLDSKGSDILGDIVACYQVQRSRLESNIDMLNPATELDLHTRGRIIFDLTKTIELAMRAGQLFPYARREDEAITPPVFSTVAFDEALLNLGLFDLLDQKERQHLFTQVRGAADPRNRRRPPMLSEPIIPNWAKTE